MHLIHALILGAIEGITEFLPISSTAHLVLTSSLLHLETSDFLKSFEIIIQLGAIIAVGILYWKRLWKWETIKKLFVAFLPTVVIGLVFYKLVKTYLLESTHLILWTLLLGGVLLIVFEFFYKEKKGEVRLDQITYKQALLIGLFQALAIIPGVSRAAATIVGGLLVGLPRRVIVEFSFLLAVPTMFAASALDIYKNHSSLFQDKLGLLIVGFVTAFIVALFSIKFLLRFIRNHNFIPFGIYRIVIAILFWFLLF